MITCEVCCVCFVFQANYTHRLNNKNQFESLYFTVDEHKNIHFLNDKPNTEGILFICIKSIDQCYSKIIYKWKYKSNARYCISIQSLLLSE